MRRALVIDGRNALPAQLMQQAGYVVEGIGQAGITA